LTINGKPQFVVTKTARNDSAKTERNDSAAHYFGIKRSNAERVPTERVQR
jgi:hypothetical protein